MKFPEKKEEIRQKRHRYKKSMMNAEQLYSNQWAQYRSQQANYAQQYQIAQQQYQQMWQRLQYGQITQQQWANYQREFVLKWRKYQYWVQYQQMAASQGLDNRQSIISQAQQMQNNYIVINGHNIDHNKQIMHNNI
eukprot:471517_1